MKTNLILPFFVFFAVFISCKKEIVKKPDRLIDKEKMVDILYDITLLSAIKPQEEALDGTITINSNQYIYKKYKIDSLQFVKSNIYYAADYKEYKGMVMQVKNRLEGNFAIADSLIKRKEKKELLLKKKKEKIQQKREKDSIAKLKKDINILKESDSIKEKTDSIKKFEFIDPNWSLYIDEYLKIPNLK